MAWRKRTLELEDGTRVEVECNDAQCYSGYGKTEKVCPARGGQMRYGGVPVGHDCKHFGLTRTQGRRPSTCKRAEARGKSGVDTGGAAG